MGQKIEIDCGEGRVIMMEGKNLNTFANIKRNSNLQDLQGEALAAAFLAAAKGNISEIRRFANGVPNNGVNSEPAVQLFNDCGGFAQQHSIIDGRPVNDSFTYGVGSLFYDLKGRLTGRHFYDNDGNLDRAVDLFPETGEVMLVTKFRDGAGDILEDYRPQSWRLNGTGAARTVTWSSKATSQKSGPSLRELAIEELQQLPGLKIL
jgi:hypothetical protein